jgi:hypothetical protein
MNIRIVDICPIVRIVILKCQPGYDLFKKRLPHSSYQYGDISPSPCGP